jgi:hypothetical protein
MNSPEVPKSDPQDDPLMDQAVQRLREVCQVQAWPLLDATATGGPLAFDPWSERTWVYAHPAVVTWSGANSQRKILLLMLTIRGAMPREVIDRQPREVSLACARLGVSFATRGPCAPCFPAPSPDKIGQPISDEELQAVLQSRASQGLDIGPWERVRLTIALPGHSLNAECVVDSVELLRTAFLQILQLSQDKPRSRP